ncbi:MULTISPECIES: heavy metal translocating P-type ATPase [Aminobacter]|uniref:P-type Zn(2+) transporter n=1 Tax=Aminobacter ciceronei TaxID=150723 RepID=A0ABR6C4U2_9HYPH|nr:MULTISPECIES: heavy metal translocating P-type ATPase [Aminobacter]MBA8906204.1 heavy metal translocating P-type ATPase [Aminobacter ciceronei]MBA9019983.1 heavy metal translocating P-type ATPase [Aminobacter ciceronei]MRX31726.1 heavy metal translocating P-type ATPase [Aminobacter sp. MDW-2]QNH32208.1 heavy metal translocating P-type ATPase [Aminobacter sp. MDW-2]
MPVNEPLLRKILLAIAVLGLAAGFATHFQLGMENLADSIWAFASAPVIAALALSIGRDLWAGRFGVDAIALVSMSAALWLGEDLAAIVVAIMYMGGNVLEDYARGRAQSDLKALTDRSPRIAHRRRGEVLESISIESVSVGDDLMVRAGEVLPVDGVLLDDDTRIDESAITGEPFLKACKQGDAVRSGTVNAGEMFHMRATAVAAESTYAGIVRMVEAAQTAKAPFIRMADRFALVLLPLTLIVAAAAWHVSGDPVRALAVLVVATPCPLILAAPIAFIAGVSRAARQGVLMKGSTALEALAKVRTAIFDKTGTLTHGGAQLIEMQIAPGRDEDELLSLLGSLEQASHHVLASAIVALARNRGLTLTRPDSVCEHRGSGLIGTISGIRVSAGSRSLILAASAPPAWAERVVSRYQGHPVLVVYMAVEGRLAAVLVLGDGLRADAVSAVTRLRNAGVRRSIMLTGDDADAANRIAATLPLDLVVADASPADKVAVVNAESSKAATMMVGDGINDAPALAMATVGVAMGARGATASSEAADVVVLTDSLGAVATAVEIASRTTMIARQSIVAGIGLSALAMIAAAFGFLSPVSGALLQEAIDVAVILNALRALGDHGKRKMGYQ